ncbi:MAG: hypothetical protein ACPIA7_04685 [Akkermansiaceae bacterium]
MVSTLTAFSRSVVTSGLSSLACVILITPQANAWLPGMGSESASSGFVVDTQSRNDVISFWNSVYIESAGYEARLAWDGSITNNQPGSTSAAFKKDVERRINFYRAMAGMDANILINASSETFSGSANFATPEGTTKQEAAQAAAFMLAKNTAEFKAGGSVTNGTANPHNPPENWLEDDSIARNGAYYSNIAIGHYGPTAIDEYISEDSQGAGGAENSNVGHRRFIFNSRLREVATGDVNPVSTDYYPANALYVIGDWLALTDSPQFIAWPNSGYIPEAITPRLWSLSYPGADFSNATVQMQITGNTPLETTITNPEFGSYADSTIVWKSVDPSAIPSAEFEDVTIDVTISNININGSTISHNYSVTVINPKRLTENTALTGNTTPPQSGANYAFDKIDHAEEYQFQVSAVSPINWTEGAEDATSDYVIDGTSDNYDFRDSYTWSAYDQSSFWNSGNKAFHLAFPDNVLPLSTETITINRTIVPKPGGSMSFVMRKGYMAPDTRLEVHYSTNDGGSWDMLASYGGNDGGIPDNGFDFKNINLESLGTQILIRFILHQPNPTGVYDINTHNGFPIGVYIDDVVFSNCAWLQNLSLTNQSKTNSIVSLDEITAGGPLEAGTSYILKVRPRIGNIWMPFGQPLEVVPTDAVTPQNYQQWALTYYPLIGDFNEDYDHDGLANGIEYTLNLNPMNALDAEPALSPIINNGQLQISHYVIDGNQIGAERSYTLEPDSWQPINVTISENGIATASINLDATTDACFIRWSATGQ